MKTLLVTVAAIAGLAFLYNWEKKHGPAQANIISKRMLCPDTSWAASEQPAYTMTAATDDISVPGVPEESEQPIKICPPQRGGCQQCH